MRIYWVKYTDGQHAIGVGQLTSPDLAGAIEQAEYWAKNHALTTPARDWSRWEIELTQQQGEVTHVVPFPTPPKSSA